MDWTQNTTVAKSFDYIQGRLLLRIMNRVRNWALPSFPIPYRMPWGGWLLLRNCDIGNALVYGVYNEQAELSIMRSILQPGMLVFDIGANQGLFTITAALRVGSQGRVYAFEPVPGQYGFLSNNCRLNGLTNVVLERMAVANRMGTAQFFEVAPKQACYSSLRKPAPDVTADIKQTCVDTTDLCSYVNSHKIDRIDFIKMDVEGGERDVIDGALPIWQSSSPPVVLMEVNDRRTEPWGYTASELLRCFEKWGYLFFQPHGKGLVAHTIKEHYTFTNILLVPKQKLPLVGALICEHKGQTHMSERS